MPRLNPIGLSLVSIAAFGLTTAASYAASDRIDWRVAAVFIAGGALGEGILVGLFVIIKSLLTVI